MHRTLRTRDRILIIGLFGAVIAYCVYGAIVGDLYIPYRRGEGGIYFSGYNAWMIAAAPLLILLGILVREREIGEFADRTRTVVEITLIFVGLALLFVSNSEPTACPRAVVATQSLDAAEREREPQNCSVTPANL